MDTSNQYKSEEIKRQQDFLDWLSNNGWTLESLGIEIGVSKSGMSRMYKRPTISTWRWGQLTEKGIPANLLPPAMDRPSGPAPRSC